MSPTGIQWTDETWNPTVGCSKVSEGCGIGGGGCYAINVAHRAMQPAHVGLTIQRKGERPDWTGEVRCLPERLDTPLKWRRPRRVFVDSMSDLFEPAVPSTFIASVFATMARSPQHTYQVLTKRPQRMAVLLDNEVMLAHVENDVLGAGGSVEFEWPLPNVWLGTSIELDNYVFRADHVRATPAAVRFLSLEPLLGPLPSLDLTDIDWVIVGGESGPGARPCRSTWVRDIRDRCVAAGVPFFFKQWGAFVPTGPGCGCPDRYRDGAWQVGTEFWPVWRVGKKAAGRVLDGRTWDEMPVADRLGGDASRRGKTDG